MLDLLHQVPVGFFQVPLAEALQTNEYVVLQAGRTCLAAQHKAWLHTVEPTDGEERTQQVSHDLLACLGADFASCC